MVIFLVIVILLLALVFGVSSMMQSYAAAKQAEAVIETAQAAQMATLGNVAIIFLLVIVVLGMIAGLVYAAVILRRTPAPRRQGYSIGVDRAGGTSQTAGLVVEFDNDGRMRLPRRLSDSDLAMLEQQMDAWEAAYGTPFGVFPEEDA